MNEPKTLPASITISRISSNQDIERPIRIRIRDEASRTEMVEVCVSLEDFAAALTGMAELPCECEWGSLDVLGKKRENKTEVVSFPKLGYERDAAAKRIVRKAIAAFEVDGWEGRDEDAFNSHNQAGTGNAYRIVFVRFVDVEETPRH